MKGNSNWNYRPYLPANRYSERGNPFICRLAPRETDCEAEWLGEGDSFTLCYSLRGQDSFTQVQTDTHFYRIENLQADREYELYVVDYKGRQSPVRLIRTGECVGTIVNYLHLGHRVWLLGTVSLLPLHHTASGRLASGLHGCVPWKRPSEPAAPVRL